MWFILKGKFFYFNEAMATYRTKWMNYLLKHHFLESYLIVWIFFEAYNKFTKHKSFLIQYMKNGEMYLLCGLVIILLVWKEIFYKSMKLAKCIRTFLVIHDRMDKFNYANG